MSHTYAPPLTSTAAMLARVAVIAEKVEHLRTSLSAERVLRLRRIGRERSIHSTLAIEGNLLTQGQVTAILEGKHVLASPREVQEVRNASLAYERLAHWQPAREGDLLAAHALMMLGLVDHPGRYRTGGVGVMDGDVVVHMAPPASRVPVLMQDLLGWLARGDQPPLIASCLFHYELEFIHPFDDGNGRMGRLWQNLILSRWQPLFEDLPTESLVYDHQHDYYRAITASNDAADAAPFVEFMLDMVEQTIQAAQVAVSSPDDPS